MSWEELRENVNYEIFNEFPHSIRKKGSNVICSESINNAGYVQICIDGETQPLHRVIAKQFIMNDNPDVLTEVNHINTNKLDNRIENLEWMSHSDNLKQRKKYNRQKAEYIDKLNTENLYQLENYNGHEFNRYYFDMKTETLYIFTRHKYKIVKPTLNGKMWIVSLNTTSGKNVTCSYNKLIREFKKLEELEN